MPENTNVTGLGNINWGNLFGAGLTGLAGGMPQTGSGTTTSDQTTTSAQHGTSETDVNLQNFLNFLSNISSAYNQQTGGTSALQTGGTTTQNVTPTLSPEAQALLTKLTGQAGNLTVPSLTGYQAQQTGNINTAAGLQSQAVNNIMASRGLGTSPVAATAAAGIEQNRLNQIAGMQQQIPILQNQLNLANLAGATSLFSTMPKGAATTGTSTGTQTGQTTGTTTGGATQTSTGQQTGLQTGGTSTTMDQTGTQNVKGTQTTKTSQGGGIGGFISGAATALAPLLLSDYNLKKEIKGISQEKAISKLRELRGREWIWKGGSTKDSGVLAQEVEEILPELVHTAKVGGTELKAVNYAGLIPYLIGAVQNLDSRVPQVEEI